MKDDEVKGESVEQTGRDLAFLYNSVLSDMFAFTKMNAASISVLEGIVNHLPAILRACGAY
jgi:hypothetical protein